MSAPARFFRLSAAAARLGISPKALRLYERHGLVVPARTAAGWRIYGPDQMARAAEVAALRTLGLGFAQIARAMAGPAEALDSALARHQVHLEEQVRDLAKTLAKVRHLRMGPPAAAMGGVLCPAQPDAGPGIAFDLPWPWGGERFELRPVPALTYIIGPLGSGKTRLARCIAETLPGAAFLGLERLTRNGEAARARLDADRSLRARVERAEAFLLADGAGASDALVALLAGLEAEGPAALVIDMVEQGLDRATQQALAAHLRRRAPGGRPLFLLTRSCAILDLDAVGPNEAILLCPANHNPPSRVVPVRGAPGYEAVATCLAAPEVRARTEGVIAWRPPDGMSPAA